MDLHAISQAVAEHGGELMLPTESRKSKLERSGKIVSLVGLGMVMLLIVSLFVCVSISKIFGVDFDSFRFDMLFPAVLAVAFPLMLAGVGLMNHRKIKEDLSGADSARRLRNAHTTERISNPQVNQPPAITEATTNLLEDE